MSTPLPSGRIRSRIAASGGRTVGVERVLRGLRGAHLEARIAQEHPERPQDLALVVADEHAPAHSLACSLGRRGGRSLDRDRKLDDEARALAGQRLGPDAAAVGLQESAGDRQAEPRCRRRRARASGRTARRCARARRRDARTLVGRPAGSRSDPRRGPGPRPARRPRSGRVLEHVRERTLELGGVRLDQREVGVEPRRRIPPAAPRPTRSRPAPAPRPSTSRYAARRCPPAAARGRGGCPRAATVARSRP